MQTEKLRGRVMESAKRFEDYANECFGWAKTARTGRERAIFLQMARTWTDAALIAKQRTAPQLQETGGSSAGTDPSAVAPIGTRPSL
jgi:hypothetical protein